MYKIIETFEYYVENPNDFCPVQEIVDKEKDLGVDNWEGYSLAMKELNTGYQKDAITNEVLLKQYLDD